MKEHEPSLRVLTEAEAWPMIVCVYAAERVSHRLRNTYRRGRRLKKPCRDYGLTEAEIPEWRRLVKRKGFTAREAANVMLRSRRP